MSAVLQKHYGDFYSSVGDAMDSMYSTIKNGDVVEVVDEDGRVYCSTGNAASEN